MVTHLQKLVQQENSMTGVIFHVLENHVWNNSVIKTDKAQFSLEIQIWTTKQIMESQVRLCWEYTYICYVNNK